MATPFKKFCREGKKRMVAEKRELKDMYFPHLKKFVCRRKGTMEGRKTEEIGKEKIHFWSKDLETTRFMGLRAQV